MTNNELFDKIKSISTRLKEIFNPVTTTNWSRGMDKSMFWRLCSLPPFSIIYLLSALIVSPN